MKITIFTLIWVVLASAVHYSSDRIDLSARPAAMGGAFVGVADDLNALEWNPAGLSNATGLEVGVLKYRKLFDHISHDNVYQFGIDFLKPIAIHKKNSFASVSPGQKPVFGMPRLSVGAGINYLGSDVFNQLIVLAGMSLRIIEHGIDSSLCSHTNYSRNALSLGIVVKYIRFGYSPGNFFGVEEGDPILSGIGSTSALTINAGLFGRIRQLRLGVIARNLIEPNMAFQDTPFGKLPASIQAGFSCPLFEDHDRALLLLAYDYEYFSEKINHEIDDYFHLGLEMDLSGPLHILRLFDGFYLRAGMVGENPASSQLKWLTYGFGFNFNLPSAFKLDNWILKFDGFYGDPRQIISDINNFYFSISIQRRPCEKLDVKINKYK